MLVSRQRTDSELSLACRIACSFECVFVRQLRDA